MDEIKERKGRRGNVREEMGATGEGGGRRGRRLFATRKPSTMSTEALSPTPKRLLSSNPIERGWKW